MDMPSASPNGGFKFYFEDVGSGGGGGFPINSGGGGGFPVDSGGGSSSAGGITAKKGRGGGGVVQGGAQPPRCQVEGCNVDLSDAKSYYSRHKVCGNHSKSPKVIVSGIEQRFCQQCSRFHLLPEFDQEKRSCRRRLAGHNERRRKPPPASLLSTQYGNSSIFGNGCGGGSFLMDFSTYPRPMDESGSQPSGLKFLPNPWQSNSESPSPELQSSANKTTYPGPVIPSGGCFAGGSDSSSCALSLLSNQPCVSRNQSSSLGANYLLDTYGSHMVQPAVSHISHFSSNTWGLKDNEAGTIPFDMHPELGLGQISQPGTSRYTSDPQPTLQSGKQQYMDLEHSMEYDSSVQHMRWSL